MLWGENKLEDEREGGMQNRFRRRREEEGRCGVKKKKKRKGDEFLGFKQSGL